MSKLLSAEFIRLFKSFIFRLAMVFSVGLGIFAVFMRWIDVRQNADTYAKLDVSFSNADGLIFIGGLYLLFAIATFIGIFVGTEYSDGTIRNKLTAGHTRGSIYVSKWIVCTIADMMMYIVNLLVVLVLGELMIGGTTMKAAQILHFTLAGIMAVVALTSFILLLSMAIQNKAAGAVACLISAIIMLFAALTIYQMLTAPEYYDGYSYVDENTGETIEVEREKNTRYLTGTKRKVYEFLNNFIPASQLYQIAANNQDNLPVMSVYDCVIIIITTGVGLVVFKKKNLK